VRTSAEGGVGAFAAGATSTVMIGIAVAMVVSMDAFYARVTSETQGGPCAPKEFHVGIAGDYFVNSVRSIESASL